MNRGTLLRGLAAIALVGSIGLVSLGSNTTTARAATTPHLEVSAVATGGHALVAAIDISAFSVNPTATVSGTGHMHITMVDSAGVPSYLYNGDFSVSSLKAVTPIKGIPPGTTGFFGASSVPQSYPSPLLWDENVFVKFNQAGDAPVLQIACMSQRVQLDFPVTLATPLSTAATKYLNTNNGLLVPMIASVVPTGVHC